MSKLALEVGKSYRIRTGDKVEIISHNYGDNYPFKDNNGHTYLQDGQHSFGRESCLDIVAEWNDEIFPKSILQEAEELINGDRAEAYGDAKTNFTKIAVGWSEIFGTNITAKQVALGMIWLKMCREGNKSGRDNIVDIAGYAGLIEKL